MTVIKNLEQVKRKHENLINKIGDSQSKALRNMGKTVQDIVARDRSFGGEKMRHQIIFKKLSDTRIRTISKAFHSSFINDGTRPHVIVPRKKKVLFWIDESNQPVFAKKVNHPGNKPFKFFDRANRQSFNKHSKILTRELLRHAREF